MLDYLVVVVDADYTKVLSDQTVGSLLFGVMLTLAVSVVIPLFLGVRQALPYIGLMIVGYLGAAVTIFSSLLKGPLF